MYIIFNFCIALRIYLFYVVGQAPSPVTMSEPMGGPPMKLCMNTVSLYTTRPSYHLVVSSTGDDRVTLGMVKKNLCHNGP